MLVFSKSLKQGHVYKYVEIWNALSTCKGNENLPSLSFCIKHLLHCRSLQLGGNVSVAYLMQTVLYRVMVMYYFEAFFKPVSCFYRTDFDEREYRNIFLCFQQWQFMRESKCSRLILLQDPLLWRKRPSSQLSWHSGTNAAENTVLSNLNLNGFKWFDFFFFLKSEVAK